MANDARVVAVLSYYAREVLAVIVVLGFVLVIAIWYAWIYPNGSSILLQGQITEIRIWYPKSRSGESPKIYAEVQLADGSVFKVELQNWGQCRPLDYIQLRKFDHTVLAVTKSCRRTVTS
jgi:hypothetical protein